MAAKAVGARRKFTHWGLAFGLLTMGLTLTVADEPLKHITGPWMAAALFAWIVPAILASAFSVVRHADAIAHRLGEPVGTLVLTLSVTGMEVAMVTSVMLTGKEDPTLARDTMFSVVMIVLAGLVGVSLLAGGLRHRLQEFNLEGAHAYLALIVPLALIGLVMPNFTVATSGASFSPLQAAVVAALCVAVYGIFLAIQTIRHREFFAQEILGHNDGTQAKGGLGKHIVLLIISLIPVVVLSEELAKVLEFTTHVAGAPKGLAGLIVAALILAPEGFGGVLSAARNQLQRSVNLLLGSALATIALTIPAVLVVGLVTGREIILGLSPKDSLLLAVTLALCVITFARGRTNVLQGAIHLLVFFVWVVLVFEG